MTISGDLDAIEEAKEVFEDERTFVRILKVDKAYYSWHMLSCSTPYLNALRDCHIEIQSPTNTVPGTQVPMRIRERNPKTNLTESTGKTTWSNLFC
jgi:hypothetical protein